MKKLLFTLFAIGAIINSLEGYCHQTTNFTGTKNVSEKELISKYKDGKVLLVRNDSTFIADIDEYGQIQNLTYTDDLKKIERDGQVSYGSKSGSLYYTQSGKLFTAKQKKNGQWVEDKYIEIPGFNVKRDKYRGSVLAYANWRYMPEDSIVILNPALNEDETVMYFASNLRSKKGLDIWKVEKLADNVWGNPQRMGTNVNSESDENYPFVTEDGNLTFASNRKVGNAVPDSGKYNIYTLDPKKDKKPELLVLETKKVEVPVVTEPVQPKQDSTLAKEVDGVSSATTPVNKEIAQNNQEPANPSVAEQPEKVVAPAEEKKEEMNRKIEKALSQPVVFSSTDFIEPASNVNQKLEEHPDTVIKISKNVLGTHEMRIFYFEFDKGIPNGTYKEDLEIVLDFINAYPDSKFLLVGHTDERGTIEYNDALSQKRAEWVYFNLLLRGIKPERLQMRADGEHHPIIKNAKTEEDHQKNRRVEIYKLN